jgi:DNA-binding transcriptional LysR family regulator
MDVLRLTLRQLQVFAAVARCGSTTAAGAEVALSQSATSSAVNELERLLSMRLFDRVGKRLVLNDNGRALLPRALGLLDGAGAIERLSHDPAAQLQSLRIGASMTLGNYVLPSLLGRFLARHAPPDAGWQSRVVIGNTSAIARDVAGFDLDIGLIEGPCPEPHLHVAPWLHDELVVVAAAGHPLARARGGVSLQALREAMWLLREPGSGTREVTDQALLPQLRAYHRSIELGGPEAIKQAAAEGVGLACLSRWVVRELVASRRLKVLKTPLPRILRQCHLIMHRDKYATLALRAFVALAMEAAGRA